MFRLLSTRAPTWAPLLLVLAALGRAGPDAEPWIPEQAAVVAAAAYRSGDLATLVAVARCDDPDPWSVAEEIWAEGDVEAAVAFSQVALRPDTAGLGAYLYAHAARPVDRAGRREIALANAALAAGDAERALPHLQVPATGPLDVVGLRLALAQARLLRILGRREEAARLARRVGEEALRIGWLARAAAAYELAGTCRHESATLPAAAEEFAAHLDVERKRRDRRGIAVGLANLGMVEMERGRLQEALRLQEEGLAIERERGDRKGAAQSLVNLGNVLARLGRFADAEERLSLAVEELRALGDEPGLAAALGNLGIAREGLGRYEEALALHEEALRRKEALGDKEETALTLNNIGALQYRGGHWAEARATLDRALATADRTGAVRARASALANRSMVHQARGDLAAALRDLEAALALHRGIGDAPAIALTLGKLALLHRSVGDPDRALAVSAEALALGRASDAEPVVAAVLLNHGNLLWGADQLPEARVVLEEALARSEALGDRQGAAVARGNLALVLEEQGDLEGALALQRRALEEKEAAGDVEGGAVSHGNLGALLARMGRGDEALAHLRQAVDRAEALGSADGMALAQWNLAVVHLAAGRTVEAIAAARRGVEALPLLVTRLSDEQGVSARRRWSGLPRTGFAAAASIGRVEEALWFLESGRAGALQEALGTRERVSQAVVPEHLAAAEEAARARLAAAETRYIAVVRAGTSRDVARRLRDERDAARAGLADALARTQRESRAAAGLVPTEPVSLGRLQALLGPDEALVLYMSGHVASAAVVLERKAARIVPLGPTPAIEAAVRDLLPQEAPFVRPEAAPRLAELLVHPLSLPEGVRRVVVSPDGPLSFVPFCLLAGQREVTCVPSGTTLAMLAEDAPLRGDGVLALGDPLYGEVTGGGYGRLPRVPATGEEAAAVGDVVLRGADATESRLREELARRPRWRALHLACHGRVDPRQPFFSSLALTPSDGDDGILTALEVLRTRIPADLVILSACETARGGLSAGEGVVGLARAFLVAGAPRVLGSLWKVDDEATRALMTRFHALWNPRDASPPLGVAAALAAAQAHVRSVERWRHPTYWAAWVVWGPTD